MPTEKYSKDMDSSSTKPIVTVTPTGVKLNKSLVTCTTHYFEVIWSIFEFFHVKKTIELWMAYANKFLWITHSSLLTETIK